MGPLVPQVRKASRVLLDLKVPRVSKALQEQLVLKARQVPLDHRVLRASKE